ncbi:MAG: type IV pilus twitching motility protein PilT [Candidatus Pacebacteria bacterium]|nr:type IV pilus twitching motility protein PilT [Candidatus Paceibacterota bacterium]
MEYTLDQLLELVHETGASDLILSVGAVPQVRVNGLLQPAGEKDLTAGDTEALVYSALTDEQMEKLHVERSLDFSREFEGLARFRFNVFFQKDCLALAARIIPFDIPGFEELGLPPIVRDFAMRPNGLVLITGPAGSGKSTTQAAMIDYINNHRQYHIVSIEDPIEYLHFHKHCIIDQREIGTDARSFSEALRCVFRQTPDVIMVGEMRDLETVELAMTLAETGHLILGTLHTQDTTHSINRVADLFPHSQQEQVYAQLSLVLQGVISQQLIITKDGQRRVLATEVLNSNDAIRNLIRETEVQQIYSILQAGRAEGMHTMNEALLELCASDLIEIELALRRSPRPKELYNMLEYRQLATTA